MSYLNFFIFLLGNVLEFYNYRFESVGNVFYRKFELSKFSLLRIVSVRIGFFWWCENINKFFDKYKVGSVFGDF